jgi:hypothetical protein
MKTQKLLLQELKINWQRKTVTTMKQREEVNEENNRIQKHHIQRKGSVIENNEEESKHEVSFTTGDWFH